LVRLRGTFSLWKNLWKNPLSFPQVKCTKKFSTDFVEFSTGFSTDFAGFFHRKRGVFHRLAIGLEVTRVIIIIRVKA
jgi:hypothetical protein